MYEPISNILKGKFPVGRVQSAVLVVLGDLEDLLKNFKSHEHYNLEVTLKQGWAAKWDFSKWLNPEMKDVHNNQWLDKASITRLQSEIDKKDLTITSVETKPSFRSAPAPFITVDLQAAAAARLGLDLKQTMDAAQKLYEGGYITYHRTDAAVISPEGMQALEAFGERALRLSAIKPNLAMVLKKHMNVFVLVTSLPLKLVRTKFKGSIPSNLVACCCIANGSS